MDQQTPGMQPGRPAVSKWLWITLIIVVLIAGGFFAWYFLMGPGKTTTSTPTTTTTTDKTAGWKTYTNSTYGLSFKYPKDWTVTETTVTNTLLNASMTNTTVKDDTNNPGLASVTLYENLTKLDSNKLNPSSVKDYLDKYAAVSDPVYLVATAKTFAGLKGYTAKMGTNQLGGGSVYVAQLTDGKIIVFRTYNTGTTQDQVDTILSTVKFTTATTATADWKTYTDSTYGFSFKYPKDWTEKDIKSGNIDVPGLLTLPALTASTGDPSSQDPFSVVSVSSQSASAEIAYRKTWGASGNKIFDAQTTTTLYGKSATKLTFKDKTSNQVNTTYYVVANGNQTYFFNYTPTTYSTAVANDNCSKILASFQFTK